VREASITPRQNAIDLAERDYGYFALISNDIKDPIEALMYLSYITAAMNEKGFHTSLGVGVPV
jgi:hypothetical protein